MSTVIYQIDRKLSRKHTYITIQKDASILVKTNYLTSKTQIAQFIDQKKAWIEKKQLAIMNQKPIDYSKIYLLGIRYDRASLTTEDLDIFYKQKAQEIILPLVKKWSKQMQLYPNQIRFRKTKSQWGSCSGKNNLSFSTHLIQTPLVFIEYVVVHELAHIKYKNHAKEFWQLVELHLSDYKMRKSMMKNKNYLNYFNY